jgi:hypothetical protein
MISWPTWAHALKHTACAASTKISDFCAVMFYGLRMEHRERTLTGKLWSTTVLDARLLNGRKYVAYRPRK